MHKPRQRHTAPTADPTSHNEQLRQLEKQLAFFVGKLEKLEAENKALRRENVSLRKENRQLHLDHQALKAEHHKLQGQLSQNSRNSHQPPSSDKPWDKGQAKDKAKNKDKGRGKNGTKPRGKSPLAQQEQKPNGGQPGHQGHTLEAVAHPDHIQWHLPEGCKHCGRHFEPSDAVRSVRTHQVFDIPQPQMEVTEHRIGEVRCCGCTQRGEAPQGVQPAPVQYGPGVHALVVLLGNYYHLSLEKSRQLIGDLFGYQPSEGTLSNLQERCHKALESAEHQIKTALRHQTVVHFDETGLDKKRWLHTATNEHLTYCFTHPKRGRAAIAGPDSLLPAFTGWAVHDSWGSYYKVGSARHVLCGAHLLRDLQGAWEREGRPWVYEMQGWLLRLLQRVQSHGGSLPQHEHRGVWARFKALQRAGQAQEPPPEQRGRGRPRRSRGGNLLKRMEEHGEEMLAFAFHREVPFTNNCAERAIRPAKTKLKVSGGWRTMVGVQQYARILSFISTVRKQGQDIWQELSNILQGHSYRFATS